MAIPNRLPGALRSERVPNQAQCLLFSAIIKTSGGWHLPLTKHPTLKNVGRAGPSPRAWETHMQRGIRTLLVLCGLALFHLALLASQLLQQLPVSSRAQMDELWQELWSTMGEELPERAGSPTSMGRNLAEEKGLAPYLLNELIRVALYFDSGTFSIRSYQRRYSHVSAVGIEADFKAMAELGWMAQQDADLWQLKAAGVELVEQLQQRRQSRRLALERLAPSVADEMLPLMERVLVRARNLVTDDPDAPLARRQASRFRFTPEAPSWARLEDLFLDLTALRNQVARERFHWLQGSPMGQDFSALDLDGLAQELLWGVTVGWASSQSDCENRTFWRQTGESCRAAFRTLQQNQLITGHPEGYRPTSQARRLVSEADQIGNLVFYSPWNALSHSEYDQFLRLLKTASRALEL